MMWRAVVVVMVAALGASSLAALPQSAVHEFAIRTQHLHIDHLEHEVDELEHELGKLSREVTPWDVKMLKGRLHRLEGTTSSPTIAYVMYTMEFCGLSSSLPSSVQNAAARVVTRSRKFDHITPVLNEFHWLPMVRRVRFKLTLIVFKCLHGLAPSYLTDDCVLVSCVAGRRPLRSVDTRTLYVPRTRTAIGARNFAVAGLRVWNSLPPVLRMLNCTVCTFAVKLKTFLFSAVSASESF